MPRVIQVIESDDVRGSGADKEHVLRRVRQYHTLEGELLAENDPWPALGDLLTMCLRYLETPAERAKLARLIQDHDGATP